MMLLQSLPINWLAQNHLKIGNMFDFKPEIKHLYLIFRILDFRSARALYASENPLYYTQLVTTPAYEVSGTSIKLVRIT